MKSKCNATHEQIVEYYQTHTVIQTTKHFSIGAETLASVCGKLGYQKRSRPKTSRKPSKEELQKLCGKYSNVQISKRLGVNESTVNFWMRDYGLRRNQRGVYQQADPNEAIRISRLHRFTVGNEYEYSFLDDNHVDKRTERTERGVCVQDCERYVVFWNGQYTRTVQKVCLQMRTGEYSVKELS